MQRALLILLLAPYSAFADLDWSSTSMETTSKADAESASVEFAYRNSGDKPVQIISAVPSCECTRVIFDDTPISPGSSGKITAIFEPGQRVGKQELEITVWADASADKPVELHWVVHLPDLLKITPNVLAWHPDDPKKERIVTIEFPTAPNTRLLAAISDDSAFSASISGNRVAVRISGAPDSEVTMLRVTTDCPVARLREIVIPLAVSEAAVNAGD